MYDILRKEINLLSDSNHQKKKVTYIELTLWEGFLNVYFEFDELLANSHGPQIIYESTEYL